MEHKQPTSIPINICQKRQEWKNTRPSVFPLKKRGHNNFLRSRTSTEFQIPNRKRQLSPQEEVPCNPLAGICDNVFPSSLSHQGIYNHLLGNCIEEKGEYTGIKRSLDTDLKLTLVPGVQNVTVTIYYQFRLSPFVSVDPHGGYRSTT